MPHSTSLRRKVEMDSVQTKGVRVSYFDIKSESLLFLLPRPFQSKFRDSPGRNVNAWAFDLEKPP